MRFFIRLNSIYISLFLLFVFGGVHAQNVPKPHFSRTAPNLIQDSNFSGSGSNWSGATSGGNSYDASVTRTTDGSQSVKLTKSYSDGGDPLTQTVSMEPNKFYTFSIYARSDVYPLPTLEIFASFNGKNLHSTKWSPSKVNEWQECVMFFENTTSSTATLELKIFFSTSCKGIPAAIWVDDAYFGEGKSFEQPPSSKRAFNGSAVRIDTLGNIELNKNGNWTPFFPLSILGNFSATDLQKYSNQGWNTFGWAYGASVLDTAKIAVSEFNPDGMMVGVQIAQYTDDRFEDYADTAMWETKLQSVVTSPNNDKLLWYYWDNENSDDEWDIPKTVINKIRELDPNHPVFSIQGALGVAPKYTVLDSSMSDIVAAYIGGQDALIVTSYTDGLFILDNIENQKSPASVIQINMNTGLLFRPLVYAGIIMGGRALNFWRDDTSGSVENELWWNDFPNIVREIKAMMPIIREPHWTSWSVEHNGSDDLVVGTRTYWDGYIIAANCSDSPVSEQLTISGISNSYTICNFFDTTETYANTGSGFLLELPAYGTGVYRLKGSKVGPKPSINTPVVTKSAGASWNVTSNKSKPELSFTLSKTSPVNFKLYGVDGRLLWNYKRDKLQAGKYKVNILNTGRLKAGVYILTNCLSGQSKSKKIVIVP